MDMRERGCHWALVRRCFLALVLLQACGFFVLRANAQTLLQTSNGHVLVAQPLPFTPTAVALDPNSGIAAFVGFTPARVHLVQTSNGEVIASVPAGFNLQHVAINPNTGIAAVIDASGTNGAVILVQTSNGNVIATVPVNGPFRVAINPNTGIAAVANFGSNSVTLIQTSNGNVIATVPVGSEPIDVAINPGTGIAAIANQASNTVTLIQTSNGNVIATVPVGSQPTDVAINPSTGIAVVANRVSGTVTLIQTSNGSVLATVPVGSLPVDVAIDPNTGIAAVANIGSDTVTLLQTSNGSVLATVPVGSGPFAVAIDPNSGIAAVPNRFSESVTLVQTSNGNVLGTVAVGPQPVDIAIDPNSGIAAVADRQNQPVTPVGTNVEVQLRKATTSITLAFAEVGVSGFTSVTARVIGPLPPPPGFSHGVAPDDTFYELTTTAGFSGPVKVCIGYNPANFRDEFRIRLYHFREGLNPGWDDVTTSVDTAANLVCGTVPSLSTFALFEPGSTLCSILGNDPPPSLLDQDVFRFNGARGERITITLSKDPVGASEGDRATLLLVDSVRGVTLIRADNSALPNQMTATLPRAGRYNVVVAEQPRFVRRTAFRGAYCVRVDSSAGAEQTFAAHAGIE